MDALTPKLIGHHEVVCLLGEGGMAQVYLALARGPASIRKLIVVKRIRDELAHDSQFTSMFLDEARLATQLNHPNVVQTYEVTADGENYSLTMEYLEGQSFEEILRRIQLGLFPLEEHLYILTQVLAGLQYAHALADYSGAPLGVVHRDVSPANIFVTYNGDVKLLDFGVARACGAICVTEAGTFKGKISYCAPEQLQDSEPPDARADIYAVGILLWEALAGKRLGENRSFQELAQARLEGKDPKVREVRPGVAPALADICDRAMAFNPAVRYLTAADFQRDLERYLEKIGRRVGRSHIAELMKRHFEAERRAIQKRIEEHLAAARDLEGRSDAARENHPRVSPGGVLGSVPVREVTPQEALTRKDGNDRGPSQAPKPRSTQSAAPGVLSTPRPATFQVSPPATSHKPMTLPVPTPSPLPPGVAPVVARPGGRYLLLALALAVVGGIVGSLKKLSSHWDNRPVPVDAIASASTKANPEPSPPPQSPSTAPSPAEQPAAVLDSKASQAGDTIHLDIRAKPASTSLAPETHRAPASKKAKLRAALVDAKAKARARSGSKVAPRTTASDDVKDKRPFARKPAPGESSEAGSNLERPGNRPRRVLDESDPYGRPEDPFSR